MLTLLSANNFQPDLWGNVKNNNNIVWKNIAVRDNVAGNSGLSRILVGNYSPKEELTRIVFSIPKSDRKLPLFDYGDLTIILSDELYRKWKEMGGKGEGVRVTGKEFKITSPNAWLGDLKMKPNEIYGIQVRYKLNKKPNIDNLDRFAFNFDVQQMAFVKEKWRLRGGERFEYYPIKRKQK